MFKVYKLVTLSEGLNVSKRRTSLLESLDATIKDDQEELLVQQSPFVLNEASDAGPTMVPTTLPYLEEDPGLEQLPTTTCSVPKVP